MRLTPFKIGCLAGRKIHLSPMNRSFSGRKRNDYLSGLRRGIIRAALELISKESNPVSTTTAPLDIYPSKD